MTCRRAHLDGPYVIGALAPSERVEFASHLSDCAECSRSVRELAGLPGLLAQVDVTDIEPEPARPLPPTLLPPLVREVRRSQRRRSALVGALAASVATVAVGALAVGGVLDGARTAAAPSAASTTAPGRPMVAVVPTPVRAEVVVASVAWGTKLDLVCSYPPGEDEYGETDYALVVRTREGVVDRVATWRGVPGEMQLSAATATRRSDIESVEVHTGDGSVVLRLRI